MASFVASLPFQIVCQLVIPGAPGNLSVPVTPGFPNHVPESSTSVPTTSPSPLRLTEPEILANGYVAYPDFGAAYKIYNESVLWKVARRRCISEGGSLAVIDSTEKFDRLSSQRESKGVTHIGIHSLFDDDEWVSVKTGLTLTNVPWATGEPNGKYHCVMIKHETGGLGNFNCSTAMGDFICEIPIPDNHVAGQSPLGQLAVN